MKIMKKKDNYQISGEICCYTDNALYKCRAYSIGLLTKSNHSMLQ